MRGREYEQRRRYIYFARTREREDLLGGQISRRRRGCGQEMGTIRSYTPEGTERRAENSWSYLAVFQRASLVYLATGGGREMKEVVTSSRGSQAALRGRGCNPN